MKRLLVTTVLLSLFVLISAKSPIEFKYTTSIAPKDGVPGWQNKRVNQHVNDDLYSDYSGIMAPGMPQIRFEPVGLTNAIKKDRFDISRAELMDKIRGGWLGQAVGVCYALPTEFKYRSKMIPDSIQMNLTGDYLKEKFNNDDIYVDAKCLEVIGRLGLDAPADSFAIAFANAGFRLFHANQAARYNILNGIMPPQSGHWKNTMHADDIDFQIEADFIGLSSAGVPKAAIELAEKVGHIMNYGDAYYSGVYAAAMYSLAFLSKEEEFVVKEALNIIPPESKFHQAMSDVIAWHKQYRDDWKKTWHAIENSDWSYDLHCPNGIYAPFNIDATVNMAYVLVGLLYGDGDFKKSMDIAMRCGQDSDCNSSTVGGIMGTLMGYSNIPEEWRSSYKEVEHIKINHMDVSLNDCHDICFKSSMENILKYGGKDKGDVVEVHYQKPDILPLEIAYPDIYPSGKIAINKSVKEAGKIQFTGTGIVIQYNMPGGAMKTKARSDLDKEFAKYVAEIEVTVDGKKQTVRKLPDNPHSRALELYFNLELQKGAHIVELNWLNPVDRLDVFVSDVIIFSDELVKVEYPASEALPLRF